MKPIVVNKYKSEYDLYIGRGSKWGNPYSHKQNTKAEYVVSSREEAINKYREYVLSNPDLVNSLHELQGKTLGCFCKPQACHGDVLVELYDKFVVQSNTIEKNTFKTYTPIQYLAIDIANHYGLDKLNYEDRIQWVKDNLQNLENHQTKAEEPILYIKAVKALRDSMQSIPTGHTVALDSVCSGLQLMSVLMGCKDGASLTGLIDPNKRTDAYSIITDHMNTLLTQAGIDNVTVTRKDSKQAIMTSLYGSIAEPLKLFGKKLLPYFYQALHDKCKGAMQLLEFLKDSWNSETLAHQWELPDGYFAHVPVMELMETRFNIVELEYKPLVQFYDNVPTEKGISNIANVIHSVDAYILRSMIRRCNYNKPLLNQFLNNSIGIQYDTYIDLDNPDIDRYLRTNIADISVIERITPSNIKTYPTEMINELRRICKNITKHKPFEIITIHDSFACHANNCNQMRYHYKEILAELADSTVITDILQQLYGDDEIVQKLGNISQYIRNSNYGIC